MCASKRKGKKRVSSFGVHLGIQPRAPERPRSLREVFLRFLGGSSPSSTPMDLACEACEWGKGGSARLGDAVERGGRTVSSLIISLACCER